MAAQHQTGSRNSANIVTKPDRINRTVAVRSSITSNESRARLSLGLSSAECAVDDDFSQSGLEDGEFVIV
jgi:hypothetical protein